MKQLTCHTAGCPNSGIPIPWDQSAAITAAQDAGATLGSPWCGGCSNPITDIAVYVPGAYEEALAASQQS